MLGANIRAWVLSALVASALVGCSNMPTVSSKIPNWPQSKGMSPEETRAVRESEMAGYKMSREQTRPTALASAIGGQTTQQMVSGPTSPAVSDRTDYNNLPNWTAQAPSKVPEPPRTSTPNAPRQLASVAPVSTLGAKTARYGDLFFISGQLPFDASGQSSSTASIEEQTRLVLEKVRSVLADNKLTLANVVSMTVHLRDLNDTAGFDGVYSRYFKGAQPTRSIVEVSRLPNNAKVEISVVAGR